MFLAVVVTSAFWFSIVLLIFAAPYSKKPAPDPGSLFVGPEDGAVVGGEDKNAKSLQGGNKAVAHPPKAIAQRSISKEEEERLTAIGYKEYGFNKVASDKIALDRGIPDTRAQK